MIKAILRASLILLFSGKLIAQDVGAAGKVSTHQKIMTTVGVTEVTVDYHSPFVKGRKIFGGIVPYDFVVDGKEYPWRAGSNQRTTITFKHDVLIDGKTLSAGTYGFVVLVSEKEWTFIFSKGKTWGAFNYDAKNDVLRVRVKTEKCAHQEWLKYDFVERQAASVKVELSWAETKAGFTVLVDKLSDALSDLKKKKDKKANDFLALAEYTLRKHPSNKTEAMKFINKSLEMKKEGDFDHTPYGKLVKADLLISMGETKKGNQLKKEALKLADGFDIYYYGLSRYIVNGSKKEAYKILMDNLKRNPKHWQGYLALGEYYLKDKNQTKATENFRKAYEYATDKWKNYARYLYFQNKLVLENK